MFQVGALIVYGSTGVCRVEDVRKMDPNGENRERLYYILRPLFQDCTISIPVDQTRVFMRPVISRAEANALIDRIPFMHAEPCHNRALHELTEHYEAALRSHDCADLVELTMSIYAKKQYLEQHRRRFGAVDERFMKRAEQLLFGELSAALGIPISEVPQYISARIGVQPDAAEA